MSKRPQAAEPGRVAAICAVAWAWPGAGHLWLGRSTKGIVFLAALPLMFAIGLGLDGELFAIDPSQPLVALAGLADLGIGVPYLLARALGAGGGDVAARTSEYGNTFLIVSGLLNALVVLDACDIAQGRK